MSDGPSILLESARTYLARGYAVIPVPARKKIPVLKGWTDLRLSANDLPAHFNGTGNIGVLLGEPSGWLVDVDLDCEEAVALAPKFLPPTGAMSGRPGKPASHWWYICEGIKTRKHQDPVSKKMIVELRSTGAQTVVGPSIHPSGEPYDPLDGEPAVPPALMSLDNVVLMPHVGSATVETRADMAQLVVGNVRRYLEVGELVSGIG